MYVCMYVCMYVYTYIYIYIYIYIFHKSTADNITTAEDSFFFRKKKKIGGKQSARVGRRPVTVPQLITSLQQTTLFFQKKKKKLGGKQSPVTVPRASVLCFFFLLCYRSI